MGVVLGLLAIAAAVYLTRRCLTQHRSAPEPGFEVDTSNLEEVEPSFPVNRHYLQGHHQKPALVSRWTTKRPVRTSCRPLFPQ